MKLNRVGNDTTLFMGDKVCGFVKTDGSGYISTTRQYSDSSAYLTGGTHSERMDRLRQLAAFYNAAYEELLAMDKIRNSNSNGTWIENNSGWVKTFRCGKCNTVVLTDDKLTCDCDK